MRHVALTDVIVATVLPFDEPGGIDWDSYRRLLDYCADPGRDRGRYSSTAMPARARR